jgi:hypothetical protein
MLFAPSALVDGEALSLGYRTSCLQTFGQSLVSRESRTSVIMQLVEFSQVSDCRDLQEIEIILAGVTKIGDVPIKGGTPAIVLTDTAVSQQVVPPSERTSTFDGLRIHGHLPSVEKD